MIVPTSPSVESSTRYRQPQAAPRSTIPPRPKPRSGELIWSNLCLHPHPTTIRIGILHKMTASKACSCENPIKYHDSITQ